MIKKLTVFIFIILLILGLIVIALVFFADNDLISQRKTSSVPEPFLCNGQPCNVILIIPETLSARHMGIYGYERDTTPFIDDFFSEESLVFENAWSNAPWTWPSFATLFTSQLPSEVFMETWKDKLCDTIPTFIDVLAKNGIPKFAAHTFTVLPFPNVDANVITRFKPEERFQADDHFLFLKAIEWIKEQIQEDSGQPFFILLQPFAPHSPYHPPEPYRYFFGAPSEYPGSVTDEELWEAGHRLWIGENVKVEKIERFRLQYDQEIRYLDSILESFISRIPEEVLQNTIFIFTSDHGEAFGQHGNVGHYGIPYEEVIHVPFLIRAPGLEPRRIQEPITLLDVAPTILDIFGLKSPETFQGTSLLTATRGEELQPGDRIVRAEELHHQRPPRAEWSNIEPQVRSGPLPYPRSITVRKGNWKLLQRGDGSLELYNLEQDPEEQNNLLNNDGIPQWHFLSREERLEIALLFDELDEELPFIKI